MNSSRLTVTILLLIAKLHTIIGQERPSFKLVLSWENFLTLFLRRSIQAILMEDLASSRCCWVLIRLPRDIVLVYDSDVLLLGDILIASCGSLRHIPCVCQSTVHWVLEVWVRLSDLTMVPTRLGLLLCIHLGHCWVGNIAFWWAIVHIFLNVVGVWCRWLHVLFDDVIVLDGSKVKKRLLLDSLGWLLNGSVTIVDLLVLTFMRSLCHVVIVGTSSSAH